MISVVLPVYNEEENLRPLHEELSGVMDEFEEEHEIVFVDDGSTDGSYEVLKELSEGDENVRVVRFKKNFGQSAALQAGFDHVQGERVVTLDSDMQNDPKDIPRLLEKLEEGYDCVSGWRHDRSDPLRKRFFSRLASMLQRPFLGKEVHDYGCTLKAYRKEAVDALDLKGEMHRYIPPLLRWKGYSVAEVKVNHRERRHGETKYGLSRLLKGFLDMLNVWFWQKFSKRPLHVFGTLGVLISGIGVVMGGFSLYLWIFENIDLSDHFLPTVSLFFFLIGIQLFTSGLIADVVLKNYYEAKDQDVYNVETVI
ncbi:MAG: glycosyltransferase family 2 protein [Candidatus Nanohaloarchaea archaeon]